MNLFSSRSMISPEDVRDLIDFSIAGDRRYDSMARLQEQGVAGLYNIFCSRDHAILADEVGMGKTYQAFGLASIIWNLKAGARVVFISPRERLQTEWKREYLRFCHSNYRREQGIGDDRVTPIFPGDPCLRPFTPARLSEWAISLSRPEPSVTFLRHTSFCRPIYFQSSGHIDIAAQWDAQRKRMAQWGLHGTTAQPGRATRDDASLQFNLAFAKAFNQLLGEIGRGERPIDLLVVDEAQCLRHSSNQTNSVLHALFAGQVVKWLFMSATPVHSGPRDLKEILNRYPGAGEVLTDADLEDEVALRKKLRPFLIRRQRRYAIDDGGTSVEKVFYRQHQEDEWASRVMSPLGTLAMGLVQKGLVPILEGRNNRYRIGFLSSFESLQASIGAAESSDNTLLIGGEEEEGAEGGSDWFHTTADRLQREPEAPDTRFIAKIATSFEKEFGFPLPHPKIDSVVDEIAPRAFGDDVQPGGEKFVVFTRRIGTVEALRDRLDRRYHQAIEERVKRCWGIEMRWEGSSRDRGDADHATVGDDPEAAAEDGTGRLDEAMAQPDGWLFRYRQTFRTTGRNSLFFEENWLARLCDAGGVNRREAISKLPESLWAESRTFSAHGTGRRKSYHRAERLHYLACQAIQRHPDVFGLSPSDASAWAIALKALYPAAASPVTPDAEPDIALSLPDEPTLWSEWSARFSGTPFRLELPGASSACAPADLYRRQVLKALIGQSFRLTDTLIDLYFADTLAQPDQSFLTRFIEWLAGSDPSAARVRSVCARWIAHLDLLIQSTLTEAGGSLLEFARRSTFEALNQQTAVVGITGGSKGNPRAVNQFRMPTFPNVIVCTDTLKEGVNLHLFCDQVVHYGVAWTSGDLEQRVGRVDRFFSQIERRLRDAKDKAEPKLKIYYPHILNSLERGQVMRVIDRVRVAERIMDSPLRGTNSEARELSVDDVRMRAESDAPSPPGYFGLLTFPAKRNPLPIVSKSEAESIRDHYLHWADMMAGMLTAAGFAVEGDHIAVGSSSFIVESHLPGKRYDIEWR
jgi:Helicase conserved C-terminal domain